MLTERALREMPTGKFVRFQPIEDLDGKPRQAVVWDFVDGCWGRRRAYFDVSTGEYLGDTIA